MNITRDIIKDLLPLYIAGEASSDTSALVASHLRDDPELARLAEAIRADAQAPLSRPSPPPDAGLAALEQTKRLLRRRARLMAFALLATGLPLSFVFDNGGIRFLLVRDAPMLASLSWAVAVALWIAFAATVRRMRVAGL